MLAEVLKNRGIDDYNRYLNLDEGVVKPYQNLDHIEDAVNLFMKHFNQKSQIGILVDEDPEYPSDHLIISHIQLHHLFLRLE